MSTMRKNEGEGGGNTFGDGVAWCRKDMIGKGSYGFVYLATLKNPKSKYSYLPSIMAVKSAEVSVSASIQKEKEVLSNLKGCGASIITCYGEEITNGDNNKMAYNLLLEYGSGGNLADRIKKAGGKGLPEFEVRCYTRSILKGLNHIHNVGYVHCDLKPENVLLVENTSTGRLTEVRAKIGDFGLAKRAKIPSKKRKLEPYWRGTPMYLSPEAVLDNVQQPPCDIWALGCIVLEMLTGKPPWDGGKDMDAEDILKKIGKGNELPKIPSDLSMDAKSFLKGCFVRKDMYRLTAEMLLSHPFVETLVHDDFVEDSWEVEDLNGIESVFIESGSDDELDYPSFSDDCSFEGSLPYWSEEDPVETENETVSRFTEEGEQSLKEGEEVTSAVIDTGCDNPIRKALQVPPEVPANITEKYPVSYRISAGV